MRHDGDYIVGATKMSKQQNEEKTALKKNGALHEIYP
jgi:hypothetical protein